MGAIVELFLLVVLCTSVGEVHGECRHVENDDMIEYSCEGGQPSDLKDLPQSTGKIRITNMPMSRITVDTFSRFGGDLWVLTCSECQIREIDPDAFRRLNNLQQLSLDNNYLTTVKEAWFRGLDFLTYLDLNFNYIESIEDGVFRNLPSLIDLRLTGNRLECLNLEDLTNLSDLKRIFLTENSAFKCPNAVSTFLENRGVLFDRDPEWNRMPEDLITVDTPYDYYTDEDETSEEPETPMPMHRERLRPTPATPPPPLMESTSSYIPPKFYTTEEVIYRPVYTPNWRTTPAPTTESYERVESTPSSQRENVARPYVPPGTIAPIDPSMPSPGRENVERPYGPSGTIVSTDFVMPSPDREDVGGVYVPPGAAGSIDPRISFQDREDAERPYVPPGATGSIDPRISIQDREDDERAYVPPGANAHIDPSMSSPHREDVERPYVPPGGVAPIDPSMPDRESVVRPYVPPGTIAPIETTQSSDQDRMTFRQKLPESTSARYPFYPPHENEDRRYEEQYYSTEANTFPLAGGPADRHETPPFVESDVGRSPGPYRTDWYDRNTVSSADVGPSAYNVPSTNGPVSNNVVQSLPPTAPEMVHPPSPDNTFQAPYYEHTITVHSPPLVGNLPAQEEMTPSMIPIETTTDKPLPNCPNRSISWAKQGSLGTIVVSLLIVAISRVLVEGF